MSVIEPKLDEELNVEGGRGVKTEFTWIKTWSSRMVF